MSNPKTLVDLRTRTPEERKKIAAAGGRASAIAKKNKKTLMQIAEMILASRPKKEIAEKIEQNIPGIDSKDVTYKTAIVFGQINAAAKGNTFAFAQIQKTIGEEPKGDPAKEDKIDELFGKIEDEFKKKRYKK